MRLKPEESKRLAIHILNLLMKDQEVTAKVSREKILAAVERVLSRHFEEERQLDVKADQLYKERAESMGAMDRGKALTMIKKQLAKEQDFVLSGGHEGRFTQDKIYHLSNLIGDVLYDDDLVDFKDEDEGPKWLKRVLTAYFDLENQVNERVRKKIASLANAPFEGSREWETLYRKYTEEEMHRIGHS